MVFMVKRTIVREHRRRTRKGLTNVIRHQRNLKEPKTVEVTIDIYPDVYNDIRDYDLVVVKDVIVSHWRREEYIDTKGPILRNPKKVRFREGTLLRLRVVGRYVFSFLGFLVVEEGATFSFVGGYLKAVNLRSISDDEVLRKFGYVKNEFGFHEKIIRK